MITELDGDCPGTGGIGGGAGGSTVTGTGVDAAGTCVGGVTVCDAAAV